jgi:arylsulfatase A-like enzyme
VWVGAASAVEVYLDDEIAHLVPNILLFTIDTFRADHTSIGGYSRDTTPNLERYAENGMTFSHAFSTHTHTLASIVGMMTGLNPTAQGAHRLNWEYNQGMDLHELDTLPGNLRRAGYKTAFFSDHFGLKGGIAKHPEWDHSNTCEPVPGRLVDLVVDWITNQEEELPYFIWVHAFGPHYPYLPNAPFDGKFLSKSGESGEFGTWYRRNALLPSSMAIVEQRCRANADGELEFLIAQYDGAIAETDAALKRVVEQLRVSSANRPWLAAISSDHGESFGERGRFWHGNSPYDSETRIPLVLYGPGVVPAGIRVNQLVSTIDLMPTILSIAAAPLPDHCDGISLLRYLKPDAALDNRLLTLASAYSPRNDGIEIAIRSKRGKLMFNWNPTESVTNLRYVYHDRVNGESENPLAFSKLEHDSIMPLKESVVARLHASSWLTPPQALELDRESVAIMESMGYLK